MKIDQNARYLISHEYARKDGSNLVVGISDHAQEALGDIVFVELPEVGRVLKKGEVFGVIESVKAASDLFAPVSGTVLAVNEAVSGNPGVINKDSYGEGWLIKIAPAKASDYNDLLDAAAYAAGAGKE